MQLIYFEWNKYLHLVKLSGIYFIDIAQVYM